ncbi:hypothetical protein CAJAP_10023 [Camponotus japonicus]
MKQDQRPRRQALFQIAKVLWHLDIFRRSFRELSGHACMRESCIFCALKRLLRQKYTAEKLLVELVKLNIHQPLFSLSSSQL